VLLFVHGFNVTFEDSLRRTAQLAYDLAFDGPAIAFSWPSQGSPLPLAYTRDQRNADISAVHLARLLERLMSGNTNVHIVAHSMGGRVLAAAIQQLNRSNQLKSASVLGEMAFLAPDIDAELFKTAANQIAASATRVTLYASSRDTALRLARRVSGYSRAGEAGPEILIVRGLHTIDASEVDTSLLGLNHSYFADNTSVLSDLFALLRGRSPEDRFGLTPVRTANGIYWRFRPATR
jgi:esterase/lipase superfamily enzyme